MCKMKKIAITLVVLSMLALVSGPSVRADGHGMVTGGIHFSVAAFGMEGWMRFSIHARGKGDDAAGTTQWQEYREDLGWRRVAAEPTCIAFGEYEGDAAAVYVVRITDISGWGDGEVGQYIPIWVHDGGTPGAAGDAFATLSWPPQDDPPDCSYRNPASPPFAVVDGGNLMIH
jgi:hypothetical protein